MTAQEKLNALQAGELELAKIKKQFDEANEAGFGLSQNDIWRWLSASHSHNAAKVEVTKVVLPVFEAALTRAKSDMEGWQAYVSDYFKDKHDAADDLAAIDQALTLLQQLKESL